MLAELVSNHVFHALCFFILSLLGSSGLALHGMQATCHARALHAWRLAPQGLADDHDPDAVSGEEEEEDDVLGMLPGAGGEPEQVEESKAEPGWV